MEKYWIKKDLYEKKINAKDIWQICENAQDILCGYGDLNINFS